MDNTDQDVMLDGGSDDLMSTSATSTNGGGGSDPNGCGKKVSITSPDATSYVAKARVTRPTPPPPSYNPMQFVAIKPCHLYQTAQQQLKKAEEVKKLKEVQKEEPEEWQNNLDNWKSSRRKRVEHIIDRVVETKKLELEEHDRTRRKSKTFTEMMEERAERGGSRGRVKLASLAVYNEDETNDLSDLGIGTSSASGKSSLSEDYDNNSVMSDNAAELDKAIGAGAGSVEEQQNHINSNSSSHHSSNNKPTTSSAAANAAASMREYISSPGYDTSSSTAPASSPDPCEYTYEGAIQDYKQRVQRASNSSKILPAVNNNLKERERDGGEIAYPTRRGSKIEDRLSGFEVTSPSDTQEGAEKQKVDVPKVDISKRKEIFEQRESEPKSELKSNGVPKVLLRERLSNGNANGNGTAAEPAAKKEVKRLSGDISSIRDRMQSLEQQRNAFNTSKSVDVPVPPLRERLHSLQSAVTKEEQQRKPPLVALVDARQLEIMRGEEQRMRQKLGRPPVPVAELPLPAVIVEQPSHDDSGIQADNSEEQLLLQQQQEQEQQLNAAIAALAIEELQLEEAAQAVNQIEAEFAELTDLNPAPLPTSVSVSVPAPPQSTQSAQPASQQQQQQPPRDMEFSINEALELALDAIDREATKQQRDKVEQQPQHKQQQPKKKKMTEQTQIQQQQQNTDDNIDDIVVAAMPNKTDEEKKKQQQQQLQQAAETNEAGGEEEGEGGRGGATMEPIYENISSAISMHEVDNAQPAAIINARRRSIPNNKSNNSNSNNNDNNHIHNQIINQTNSNNNQTDNNNTHTTTAAAATATTTSSGLIESASDPEPYYQVPKAQVEPYYDAPKHLRPIPVYENIEIFYTGLEINASANVPLMTGLEPPKEKPPPPPTESPPPLPPHNAAGGGGDDDDELDGGNTDTWSSDNTYETIAGTTRRQQLSEEADLQQSPQSQPSPPMKRMNSTKRIKKELRNKRSSFLGIETGGELDDVESYLELTVAPPPDMAQLLQEERRLEKQLYIKAGLCDSSDTGESRDSGVSENHSRQSSEHYTNSSEENDTHSDTPPSSLPHSLQTATGEVIYQNETLLAISAAQTPLLQTVKGNSAESWTESATAAAAATQSLSEATATANAKMLSIEEKIREQGEVLRVERELLHFSQEELKRQRENLLLRENLARRELQHGAQMLMAKSQRRSLQDLHNGLIGNGMLSAFQPPQAVVLQLQQQQQQAQQQVAPPPQHQIYANVPQPHPNPQQYYQQVEADYRKSMSDLNEFSKRLMLPPTPPTKPLRAMHIATSNGHGLEPAAPRQRHSLTAQAAVYGGSLVKIASPATAAAAANYAVYQSAQNLSQQALHPHPHPHAGNMSRNTLHALSATPKPKYTDGWVQVQQRKNYDSHSQLANDPAWLSAYQQKRKSMPDYNAQLSYNNNGNGNHWLVQEAEQRRLLEQQQPQQRRSMPAANGGKSNGKPLPDSIIQTLTERVQSKGIGERKRFDNGGGSNYSQINGNNNFAQQPQPQQQQQLKPTANNNSNNNNINSSNGSGQEKVLSVSGKKKCSHCGDELGRGAAMIIESLLLFYHINCFKCCVCHVQLGDGLNGTDVRVRNHKLHCQNCYSSDDGIKFSCV